MPKPYWRSGSNTALPTLTAGSVLGLSAELANANIPPSTKVNAYH